MKKEYIERAKLLGWLNKNKSACIEVSKALNNDIEKHIAKAVITTCDDFIGYAESMPAADVAPVVYCKDCKHWASHRHAKYGRCLCVEEIAEGQWHTQAEDFCSHGERIEE